MKDEIKEILDKLKNEEFSTTLFQDEKKQLLDYIISLQEELEEQKRIEEADFKLIQEVEEENERLKDVIDDNEENAKYLLRENKHLERQLDTALSDYEIYRDRCDKAIKYLRSYESICTIQELDNEEKNEDLDEKTFVEIVHRYLKVHDKLLNILEELKGEE